jgi:hypothetical protein
LPDHVGDRVSLFLFAADGLEAFSGSLASIFLTILVIGSMCQWTTTGNIESALW